MAAFNVVNGLSDLSPDGFFLQDVSSSTGSHERKLTKAWFELLIRPQDRKYMESIAWGPGNHDKHGSA